MASLNNSSTNSVNSSLSSTSGKHWRQRCVLELPNHECVSREFAKQSCPWFSSTSAPWLGLTVKCLNDSFEDISVRISLVEVTPRNVFSALDSALLTTQQSTADTFPFIFLLLSGWLLMLWRLSKNNFFSLFNWPAKDWSSFFPFPFPGSQKKRYKVIVSKYQSVYRYM